MQNREDIKVGLKAFGSTAEKVLMGLLFDIRLSSLVNQFAMSSVVFAGFSIVLYLVGLLEQFPDLLLFIISMLYMLAALPFILLLLKVKLIILFSPVIALVLIEKFRQRIA